MPLPLETVIPKDCLPDVLLVYDKDTLRSASNVRLIDNVRVSLEKFLAHNPIKFVRKYPSPLCGDTTCDVSRASDTFDPLAIGQLDLRQKQHLGEGSHSYVFRAPLTLPSCAGPSLHVAVKITKFREKVMLANEAKIYDKFPWELQQSPPVVPRFYGYYVPSFESVENFKGDDGDEEDANKVGVDICKLWPICDYPEIIFSPILLLEPCGEQVKPAELSKSNRGLAMLTPRNATANRDTIASLYSRLHDANFTQGSVYPRNVLVQPGPLTNPPAERSFDDPSYRIIDFGRGECYGGVSWDSEDRMADELRKAFSRMMP